MRLHKGMTNVEIEELLRGVAAAYKLRDEDKNRFKIVAYERAADAVEHASSEMKDMWDDGKLEDVAGIGKSIASHLDEIFRTGKSEHFDDLLSDLPVGMIEIMKVGGVGPKSAYKIASKFKLSKKTPLEDLKKLASEGKIAGMEGFGKDSEQAILKSIDEVQGRVIRLLYPYAKEIADEVIQWLEKSKDVVRADALGSLRRKEATVGDVDLAASTNKPDKVIEHFCKYPNATRVLEKGDRTASIIVPGDRQVDLMVETPDAYGALLQHFTGSKHHNIALRKIALKKNLSVSDYGIYLNANDEKKRKLKKFKDEESFYKFLGLQYIPPELRQDRGEIELAQKQKLPKLVELSDVKADLHMHSNFDIETSHDLGQSSMEEMIEAANEFSYEYIAFTEHNPSKSKHSEKQIMDLLKKKKESVDKINSKLVNGREKGVKKVFNSLEIDMLKEGGLPVSGEGLELLDFALVSIHSSFNLTRDKMTRRVLDSLEHPKAKIFAHPTGRKLNEREGVELDWEKIFEFCVEKEKWIEINCSPSRLDLPDTLVKDAIDAGVILTLGTDSHHKDHMVGMPYGVNVARRGWCEKKNIVNTYSLKDFEKMLIYI